VFLYQTVTIDLSATAASCRRFYLTADDPSSVCVPPGRCVADITFLTFGEKYRGAIEKQVLANMGGIPMICPARRTNLLYAE
jgi:hypothetical protein